AAVLREQDQWCRVRGLQRQDEVNRREFNDRGANWQGLGSKGVPSHPTGPNTVQPKGKGGVPMNRAKASAPRAKVSGETVKLGSLRLLERGISKSSTAMSLPLPAIVTTGGAPVLGQQLVEDVIDGDHPDEAIVLVGDRHRHQ